MWHTVHGGGPFVAATTMRHPVCPALYLAVLAVTGLVLAAAVQWERSRATRALRQSEERLRLALDSARMGIWFWSVETNTLVWDENLRRLFGLTPGEVVSGYEDFLARVHPDDRAAQDESVRRARAEGGDLDTEFRVLLPGGRVRWIANQSTVGRDETGRVQYLTGVCMDATERRLAEERIRRAHRMESIGRLAGGVAHEANNQMTVVLGAARLILGRSDVPPDIRTDMEYIRNAAERTAAVTAQLLAFSRQQLLRPALLELNQLVQGWEPVLRRVMGEDCVVLLRLGPMSDGFRRTPGSSSRCC